jgi:hypothetical protein
MSNEMSSEGWPGKARKARKAGIAGEERKKD